MGGSKRRSDGPLSGCLCVGRLRSLVARGGVVPSAENVDGRRPCECVASNNRGLGAGCCVSGTEPGFQSNQHEPEVRDGLREGRLAARYSDQGWLSVFSNL